ncbi:hypothetical protein DFH06DRAFT_1134286 [Mycena polygramma]|nr:hypothetical protein DFH06DRAFT_1134286 [Mycena polygramma]
MPSRRHRLQVACTHTIVICNKPPRSDSGASYTRRLNDMRETQVLDVLLPASRPSLVVDSRLPVREAPIMIYVPDGAISPREIALHAALPRLVYKPDTDAQTSSQNVEYSADALSEAVRINAPMNHQSRNVLLPPTNDATCQWEVELHPLPLMMFMHDAEPQERNGAYSDDTLSDSSSKNHHTENAPPPATHNNAATTNCQDTPFMQYMSRIERLSLWPLDADERRHDGTVSLWRMFRVHGFEAILLMVRIPRMVQTSRMNSAWRSYLAFTLSKPECGVPKVPPLRHLWQLAWKLST